MRWHAANDAGIPAAAAAAGARFLDTAAARGHHQVAME